MESVNQVSTTINDYAPMPDSDCESSAGCSSPQRFKEFSRIGMVRLDESGGDDRREFSVIKKCFLVGIGSVVKDINVVAVHKNSYSSFAGQTKLEVFRIFSQAVAVKRGGDANVKFAWYGGSRDEICGIVAYGFGRPGELEKSSVNHGIGVHLSARDFAIDSAMKARGDENGVRHVLLCRVILGNTETITAGSNQFQPSSINFDSGVDHPLSPRKYIIWTAYMNSHIFPNYVVSFTAPSLSGSPKLISGYVRFRMLMNVMSRFLHPSKIRLISNFFNDYWEHKIDKPELIRRLRGLVGDEILLSVMKLLPSYSQR